jgi:hypothetical protein
MPVEIIHASQVYFFLLVVGVRTCECECWGRGGGGKSLSSLLKPTFTLITTLVFTMPRCVHVNLSTTAH